MANADLPENCMTATIRTLIALTICAALAFPAAAQDSFPDGTEISLLQWSHFVPAYDDWFTGYIRDWGAANNVSVTVDHVNFAELPASLAAEIDAGQGHTIIELPSSPASLVQGLHDLSDLNSQATARFGEQRHHCKAVTYLPAVDAYYGFSVGYALNHGNYDIELWAQAGYPQGPENYEDLLAGGRAIYETTGIPVGIGISPEIDSEIAIREVIWSFGGGVQDARGNPAFQQPGNGRGGQIPGAIAERSHDCRSLRLDGRQAITRRWSPATPASSSIPIRPTAACRESTISRRQISALRRRSSGRPAPSAGLMLSSASYHHTLRAASWKRPSNSC